MKKYISLLLLTLCVWLVPLYAAAAALKLRADFPPVLVYHDVREEPLNYADVSVDDFRAQLDYLSEEGYQTLSMEEFVDVVKNGRRFPAKTVLITFDGAYRGIFDYAMPELIERGMYATFFIPTNCVDKMEGDYPHITLGELSIMANNPLFSFGSQTMSDSRLDLLPEMIQTREDNQSRELLAAWTGREIDALAFPYGAYNKGVITNVQAAGYTVSFAIQERGDFHELPQYSIPRIYMGFELGAEHIETFGDYLNRYKRMPSELFVERWEFL